MTATDIGTLVAPGVILDRRIQDELRPPCEVIDLSDDSTCPNEASWTLLLDCGCASGAAHALVCDDCKDWVLNKRVACTDCGHKPVIKFVEPLR